MYWNRVHIHQHMPAIHIKNIKFYIFHIMFVQFVFILQGKKLYIIENINYLKHFKVSA